ncbi:MAG: hypothetical protein AAF194_07290 [Pseudomonadota bacterium]
MNEIICPKCKAAFKVDEAGFADILKQVRDKDFEAQLQERLRLAEKDKISAIEVVKSQLKSEFSEGTASKDAEIKGLKAKLDASSVSQQLAVKEAVTELSRERDELAGAISRSSLCGFPGCTAYWWLMVRTAQALPATSRRSSVKLVPLCPLSTSFFLRFSLLCSVP